MIIIFDQLPDFIQKFINFLESPDHMLKPKYYSSLFLCLLLLPAQFLLAQSDADQTEEKEEMPSLFSVLSQLEEVNIELNTDFKKLMVGKNKEEYQNGEFKILRENGDDIILPVEVRARGRFRKKICGIPPIKIKFNKDGLKENGFRKKFNELKVVSHCDTTHTEIAESIVLREFLAYKIYNEITPHSLKTLVLEMSYVDSEDNFDFGKHFAFFIEDYEDLEHRENGKMVEAFNISKESLDSETLHRMILFQYMIGNTDWRVNSQHNIKFLVNQDSTIHFPIAYDFDFSGFVNAYYGIPNPDYKLTSLRERRFLSDSLTAVEICKTTIPFFQTKKEVILKMIKEFKQLPKINRKDLQTYIKSFYKIISDEESAMLGFMKRSA